MIYFKAMPTLLQHVFDELPEEEREEFLQTAEEFSSGLNATIEGARNYLRRTSKSPPSFMSTRWLMARRRTLALLDAIEDAGDGLARLDLRGGVNV